MELCIWFEWSKCVIISVFNRNIFGFVHFAYRTRIGRLHWIARSKKDCFVYLPGVFVCDTKLEPAHKRQQSNNRVLFTAKTTTIHLNASEWMSYVQNCWQSLKLCASLCTDVTFSSFFSIFFTFSLFACCFFVLSVAEFIWNIIRIQCNGCSFSSTISHFA